MTTINVLVYPIYTKYEHYDAAECCFALFLVIIIVIHGLSISAEMFWLVLMLVVKRPSLLAIYNRQQSRQAISGPSYQLALPARVPVPK
jgi:hypothetical protein